MSSLAAFDAVFVAAAVTAIADRRGRLAWVALVPLVAVALGAAADHAGVAGALAAVVPIAIALAATAPPVRAPAPALVLAAPLYPDARTAIVTALMFLSVVALSDVIAARVDARDSDSAWAGAPARLLVLAGLYAAWLPLGYL